MYIAEIDMVRTQIYLTEKQQQVLERLAKSRRVSKSDLIREQIDKLVSESEGSEWKTQMMRMAGLWESRTDLPDFGVARKQLLQRQRRLFNK